MNSEDEQREPVCKFADGTFGYDNPSDPRECGSVNRTQEWTGCGEFLIDQIIKGRLVRTDDQEPTVLIWNGNSAEQLEAAIQAWLASPKNDLS